MDSPDPFLGQEFEGRYKIEKRLGQGGMGAVYQATQLAVGRPVAIKILHSSFACKEKELLRFQQEARAVAALDHPNSIRLFDFGQTDDQVPYLVMEFLKGWDLAECLKEEGPMPAGRVLSLSLQVFGALSEAHSKGIVHRDLKPANLFLTQVTGEGETVKVLDFGIAKVRGELGSDMTLTQQGTTIGSPRYMAPEQARALEIKPATDIYAMGCILYEMLTGRPVFIRQTASDYIIAHVKEDPPWPRIGEERLEGPLIDFVLRCLKKRTEDRPKDAAEALASLKRLDTNSMMRLPRIEEKTRPLKRPKSEIGIFKPVLTPRVRAQRLSGPLSTSQIGMAEDPTAPMLSATKDRVWWGLSAVGVIVTSIGLAMLAYASPDRPSEPSNVANDSQRVAVQESPRPTDTRPHAGSVTKASGPSEVYRNEVVEDLAHIRINSQPPGALVWRGETRLGVTPLRVHLPYDTNRVFVRLTLPDHRTSRASFVPSGALSMTVPLSRLDAKIEETPKP